MEFTGCVSKIYTREQSSALAALKAFLVAHPFLYPSNPNELTVDIVCGQTMWKQWAAYLCYVHVNERTGTSLTFSTVALYVHCAWEVMKDIFGGTSAGKIFFVDVGVGPNKANHWLFGEILQGIKYDMERE